MPEPSPESERRGVRAADGPRPRRRPAGRRRACRAARRADPLRRWRRASTSSSAGSRGASSGTSPSTTRPSRGCASSRQRGSVVYVMRYASRLDYFLFNALFLREGLRLSAFANGIRFWYYRPLRDALRTLLRGGARGVPQDAELCARASTARARRARAARSSCSCAPRACARVARPRGSGRGRAARARPARRGGRVAAGRGTPGAPGAARALLAQGAARAAALPEPLLRRADAARPTSPR